MSLSSDISGNIEDFSNSIGFSTNIYQNPENLASFFNKLSTRLLAQKN